MTGHAADEVPVFGHVLYDLLVTTNPFVLSMEHVAIRVSHVEEAWRLDVDLLECLHPHASASDRLSVVPMR